MPFSQEPLPPLADVRRVLRSWIVVAAAGRWTIAVVALLTFICAVFVLRLIEPRYTATLIVGPTSESGLIGMGARLPGLLPIGSGSMVIHGEGETMSDFGRFLYLATSIAVAEELAASPDLMHKVFDRMWDAEAGRWVPDGGPGARLRRLLSSLAGRNSWTEPDSRVLARYLQSEVRIQQVTTTALRQMSFRHTDPEFARLLLTRIYYVADGMLRDEAGQHSDLLIQHTARRLEKESKLDHRRALIDLLVGYERTAMMVEVNLPFAADLVQPAMTGPLPDTPDPAFVLPVAAAFGLALGFAVVFTRAAWRGTDGSNS